MKIIHSPLLLLGLISFSALGVEVHSPPSHAFISQMSDIDSIQQKQPNAEAEQLTFVTASECNNQTLLMNANSLNKEGVAYHQYVEELWQRALNNEYFYIQTQGCPMSTDEWISNILPCNEALCGKQYVADKHVIWLNAHLEPSNLRQATIGIRTPLLFDQERQLWQVTGYFVEKGKLSDRIALQGFTAESSLKNSEFVDELSLFFPNGSLRQVSHFNQQGKKNGTEHRYYKTGQIHQTARYLDGQLNGSVLTYHANGNIESNVAFIHDEHADGECLHYNAEGNLSRSHTFKKGDFDGKYIDYFDNGLVKTVIQYDNGVMMRRETFHANGQPESLYELNNKQTISERYNVQGKLINRDRFAKYAYGTYPLSHETWFSNGNRSIEEIYDERGLRHGKMQSWYQNGQTKELAIYEHGHLTEQKRFSSQGKQTETIAYLQDKKNGPHKKWSAETGKLIYELTYSMGLPASAEKHYEEHSGELVEIRYLDKNGQPLNHLFNGQAPIQRFTRGALTYMRCGQDNYLSDVDQLMAKAKNNDGAAQYALGLFYHQCNAKEQTLNWLTQAAENNNIDSIQLLISIYRTADGNQPQNKGDHIAWQYMLKAVELKQPNALFEVGFHYLPKEFAQHLFQDWTQYDFVTPNENLAFAYIKQAADLGNPKAIYATGLMFQYGIGVDASDEIALRYFHKLQDVLPDLAQTLIAALPAVEDNLQ